MSSGQSMSLPVGLVEHPTEEAGSEPDLHSSCGGVNGQRLSLSEGGELDQPKKYHLQALADALSIELTALGRLLKVSGSTWKQYRDEGVSELVADRLAVKCGFHPFVVWPEMIDHVIDDCSITCAADDCDRGFIPAGNYGQRFCSDRCKQRQYNRDRYRSDPEYRARVSARRRRYYSETAEIAKKQEQERYWSDPEAARARRRARYWADPEAARARRREGYQRSKGAA